MMPRRSSFSLLILKSELLHLPSTELADRQGQEGEGEKDKEGKDYQAIDGNGSEALVGR